ncbi:MAG: c-type cytochrome [Candidatus Binatia bacterium]
MTSKNNRRKRGPWSAVWKTGTVIVLLVAGGGPLIAAQPSKGDPKAGKTKYDMLCAGCHGPEGRGNGPAAGSLNLKPADLSDADYVKNLTDKYLYDVIKDGGAKVKKSPLMPGWGGALNDRDIWNLVAYLRTLSSRG